MEAGGSPPIYYVHHVNLRVSFKRRRCLYAFAKLRKL